MKRAAAVICLALLSGCVQQPQGNDPLGMTPANVQIADDPALGIRKAVGPIRDGHLGRGWRMVKIKDGASLEYGLIVYSRQTEWAFYSGAWLDGEPVSFAIQDREVLGCTPYGCDVSESLIMSFPESRLARYRDKDMSIAVIGTRDRFELIVPYEYVRLMLGTQL